ncbi:MAG TPA: EAL domain-containing protein [Solirubrobacteraceae bacterium]|nr:EAL domain-containing protein [Solirubrobacteraceae bacterium]
MGGSAEPTIDVDRLAGRSLIGGRRPARPPGGSSTPAGLARTPWLALLRRALREDRFVLHYQPIVSLRDGRISHHEALVRLVDERGGLIAPGEFLPAAERHGVIRAIDRDVLDKALAALACAPEARPPRVRVGARPRRARDGSIAVNLSALSLTDPRMLAFLQERLAHHRVGGHMLVLELTETASISDMPAARAFCAGAAALGCEIALDDFGAGFGSFHYLRHLEFAYLKIDGAFIRGLADSEGDRRVVSSLVALARSIGARTIAEYVQDARTLRLLFELGVDYAQGFAVGRPRPLPARP